MEEKWAASAEAPVTKVIRRSGRGASTLTFVLSAFLFATVGSATLLYAIQARQPLWTSISVGCVVGLYWLNDRKRVHDEMAQGTVMRIEPAASTESATTIVQAVTTTGTTQLYGRFKLTAEQWQRLGQCIVDNDGYLRRDNIPYGIFRNRNQAWQRGEIDQEMRRMGWLDSSNRLTPAGADHFAQFGVVSPTLLRNGRSSS